jgi:hypothetical protein
LVIKRSRKIEPTTEQETRPSEAASFKNVLEVLGYLQGAGWKISQPGLYKHVAEGKLTRNPEGAFGKIAVDKYARTFLRKKDGSSKVSDQLNDLQREKLLAETRMATARASHWEIKTKETLGELVPRDAFERELAARASVLKSDDENWIFGAAGDIIALVKGDPALEPDLIEFMRTSRESVFARYADEKAHFTAPAAPERQAARSSDDFDAGPDDDEGDLD